ncbi:AraC family transcriptional regulator [Paenibacillus sp. 3LSP]|jgi:AraC-like DNA-binding protein|uniref:AraC family transcriptional regulator n=1 Tax=Paenibacillus sp. 3LSP TaxID=2800795 RepID=UPI002905CE30|nr:AraC family transcriptional regulator [Paenibacillus sp. 3LSP]
MDNMEELPMDLLPLRSNLTPSRNELLPLSVYTVGTEIQPPLTRMKGFSAHQLFLTISGTGQFRRLYVNKDKWDILRPGQLLYIPAGCAHEYMPYGEGPWFVGYVTLLENFGEVLNRWGFGDAPRLMQLSDISIFTDRLLAIWQLSGNEHDPWRTTELLYSLFLAILKDTSGQTSLKSDSAVPWVPPTAPPASYRASVVDVAVRFLHDHLNRPITIAGLAGHVGYSQKQLTRLFRQAMGLTPLQYLHQIRLKTARHLLLDHPDMTIRQAAAYVGLEPVYFARLYKREFGRLPSEELRGRESS